MSFCLSAIVAVAVMLACAYAATPNCQLILVASDDQSNSTTFIYDVPLAHPKAPLTLNTSLNHVPKRGMMAGAVMNANNQILVIGSFSSLHKPINFTGYIADVKTGKVLHDFHLTGPFTNLNCDVYLSQFDAEGNVYTSTFDETDDSSFTITVYNVTTRSNTIAYHAKQPKTTQALAYKVQNGGPNSTFLVTQYGPSPFVSASLLTLGPAPDFNVTHQATLTLPPLFKHNAAQIAAAAFTNTTTGEGSLLVWGSSLHNKTQIRIYRANLYTGGAIKYLGMANFTGQVYPVGAWNAYFDGQYWWVQDSTAIESGQERDWTYIMKISPHATDAEVFGPFEWQLLDGHRQVYGAIHAIPYCWWTDN